MYAMTILPIEMRYQRKLTHFYRLCEPSLTIPCPKRSQHAQLHHCENELKKKIILLFDCNTKIIKFNLR